VADEKHSRWLGKRIYIGVTAAKECFLGVGIAHSADETGLTQAYGEFQQEALALNPQYCPDTVNTDGWDAENAIPRGNADAVFPAYGSGHSTAVSQR
jgi:hypothetical protein